jgi:hypothetical protein
MQHDTQAQGKMTLPDTGWVKVNTDGLWNEGPPYNSLANSLFNLRFPLKGVRQIRQLNI